MELEAEQQNLQTAPNAYPFLDVYRKYRKLEEVTRPMVVELIEKIEVYEGNRVEITFRFQDEISDLLEELHQKQMGQHTQKSFGSTAGRIVKAWHGVRYCWH